jgi:hypothetical protein
MDVRRSFLALAKLVLLGCLVAAGACSDDDGGTSSVDAMPTESDAGDVCRGVGAACLVDGECTNQLKCYATPDHGVCAPERAGCGGILGTVCADGLSCVYLEGSADLGMCVTADELSCICAESPTTVQGC